MKILKITILALCTLNIVSQAQERLKITQAQSDGKMPLLFKKGIAAENASRVTYTQADGLKLEIELKQPVNVSVADQAQKWGHFQF